MLTVDQMPSSSLYSSRHFASLNMPASRTPKSRFMHKHLFIVTGPAGSGKTTVAESLSRMFDFPYLEGDNYHSIENVDKMKNGIPLTDADRWDWLVNVREAAVDQLDGGFSGVVLTCSALKKKYRDVIRIARYDDHDVMIHFIFLSAPKEVLMQRVADRKGHFMKSSMVISQLQSLEEPKMERDVHSIDVSGTPKEVESKAADAIKQILAQDVIGTSNRTT